MRKVDYDKINVFHEFNVFTDTRELFLHGLDEDDSGVDHRMAATFIKNLRMLEHKSKDIITIHQFSIGGDWSAGMAIYDAIKYSECQFVFLCHGIAASMGSIIPQAARGKGYRVTMPNCDWLIHEGNLYLEGIPGQVKSNFEITEACKKNMYNIYTDACVDGDFFSNYSKSRVERYIKKKIQEKTDWYLSGTEAVKYGFVDGVFGTEGWETLTIIKGDLSAK